MVTWLSSLKGKLGTVEHGPSSSGDLLEVYPYLSHLSVVGKAVLSAVTGKAVLPVAVDEAVFLAVVGKTVLPAVMGKAGLLLPVVAEVQVLILYKHEREENVTH